MQVFAFVFIVGSLVTIIQNDVLGCIYGAFSFTTSRMCTCEPGLTCSLSQPDASFQVLALVLSRTSAMLVSQTTLRRSLAFPDPAFGLDVAETAPKHLRGAFGSFFQFFLVIGGSCAYFASYGSKLHISNTSSAQWRLPFAMQALPGFILLVGLFFIKESPRYAPNSLFQCNRS